MPSTSTPSRGGEAGDRAQHRDPVISAGADHAAAQAADHPRSQIPPRSPRPRHRVPAAPRSPWRSDRSPCGAALRRRGSSSFPAQSRPPGRPAAARRSPAESRRRRPRPPCSGPPCDPDRADRLAAALAACGSTSSSAPIRSRIPSSPVRVGLRPTPVEDQIAAGNQQRGDERRRPPRRNRPGRRSRCRLELGRLGAARAARRCARSRPRRRRAFARCDRGSGSGSLSWVSPSASSPAKSRQDLTWALATRQLVG